MWRRDPHLDHLLTPRACNALTRKKGSVFAAECKRILPLKSAASGSVAVGVLPTLCIGIAKTPEWGSRMIKRPIFRFVRQQVVSKIDCQTPFVLTSPSAPEGFAS